MRPALSPERAAPARPSAPAGRDEAVRDDTCRTAYLANASVELCPIPSRSRRLEGPGAAGAPSAGAPTVLGQHRNTYIVATDGEDIVLVDQHTAHERVRFETHPGRGATKRGVEAQILLAPLVTCP